MLERAPVADRAVAELDELGVALARHHEERSRARDDEEPRRDRNADRDAARDRAQHEPRRDAGEVEHRFVLQPQAVEQRQDEVAADHERELPARGERQRDRRGDQQRTARDRGPRRDLPGRDRAEPLRRVAAVGLDVERVVDVVRAARREAEAHERDRRAEERGRLAEHAGGAGRRDHEDVLHPLLGPRQAHPRRRAGRAARVRAVRARGGSRPPSWRAQISSVSCSTTSTRSSSVPPPRRIRSDQEDRRPESRRRRCRRGSRARCAGRASWLDAIVDGRDERDDAGDPRERVLPVRLQGDEALRQRQAQG